MARFNIKAVIQSYFMPNAVNFEGAPAFTPSNEMALYLRACSSFLEDKFYESAGQEHAALVGLVQAAGQEFTLKLASYARQQMHLRSLPVMLLAEAAALKVHAARNQRSLVRQHAPSILQRADEPAELIAYWLKTRGSKKNFPASLKRGISDAMVRFDEYHLAKYKGDSKAVKLRDVLAIAHPTSAGQSHRARLVARTQGVDPVWDVRETERQRFELLGRAFKGALATPETWETYISKNGASAETWNAVAPKMGLFALVRNLRNFEDQGASDAIELAVAAMRNPEQVRRSRMLPFRWLAALKATRSTKVQDAIREALELSIANIPRWAGRTAVFADNSGSMRHPVSARSSVERIEIAGLMAAMSLHLSDSSEYRVGAFGETFQWVGLTKRDSVLTNAKKISDAQVGHATHAWLALAALVSEKIVIDRVVIVSDEECYGQSTLNQQWAAYRARVNPKARLYVVNLAGYGTMQFSERDGSVCTLGGFSDNTLRLIPALDAKVEAVDVIRNWNPMEHGHRVAENES